MASWLPYPLSSFSWSPPHNNNNNNNNNNSPTTRTGPTAAHLTTVAASLRLGHFIRRRLLHRHNLNLVALRSSFEDAWNCKDSQSIRFSFLHSSNDFSAVFSSLLNCFAGTQKGSEGGTGESSSSGMEESLSSGTGQSSSSATGESLSSGTGQSSSSGKSRKNIFEGRHWTNILLAINLLVYTAEIATQGKLLPMGAKSQSPSLGASGALFGLVGATTVIVWRHSALTAHGTEDLRHIGHVLLINLALGLSFKNVIDNWGHLGGLLGGAAATWFLGPAWEIESTTEDGRRILVDKAPVFCLLKTERPQPRNRFF
ncbi:RHOMBOID-like protein [Drosera capensis]